MANVTVRPYRGHDEIGIVTCWNTSCPRDKITMQSFTKNILKHANFHPPYVYVAEHDGIIVGFIIGMSDMQRPPDTKSTRVKETKPTGWITAFAVHPAYRGRGLANTLITQLLHTLKVDGHARVRFSDYPPYYILPGLDTQTYPLAKHVLKGHDFTEASVCVAMARSLVHYSLPSYVTQMERSRALQGYDWHHVTPHRVVALLGFLRRHFGVDWHDMIQRALNRGIESSRVLLAIDPNDDIAGFTLFGGADERQGRFGPFGVHPAQRGRGIGTILLHRTLATMKKAGIDRAWFLWVAEHTPAFSLYKQAGFHMTRRFHILERFL